eukprot:scaffold7761_cov417-Prasinococcus_capsulatus_cf.AAC.6
MERSTRRFADDLATHRREAAADSEHVVIWLSCFKHTSSHRCPAEATKRLDESTNASPDRSCGASARRPRDDPTCSAGPASNDGARGDSPRGRDVLATRHRSQRTRLLVGGSLARSRGAGEASLSSSSLAHTRGGLRGARTTRGALCTAALRGERALSERRAAAEHEQRAARSEWRRRPRRRHATAQGVGGCPTPWRGRRSAAHPPPRLVAATNPTGALPSRRERA